MGQLDVPTRLNLLGLVAGPLAVEAQQAAKIVRIGRLAGNLAATPHLYEAFRQGLRDVGYAEGRNLVIETPSAEGKPERLPALADEPVALNGTKPAGLPVEQPTSSIWSSTSRPPRPSA